MAACGTCPDAVTFTLRRIVQTQLDSLRSIKSLTDVFSNALKDIAGLADVDAASLLDAVPEVPSIGIDDILGYLTCPLTPLAVALDPSSFSNLDPSVQLQKLRSLSRATIEQARASFESGLDASPYKQVMGISRKYVGEMTRLRFDAEGFASAVVIAGTILALCPDEYEAGPYLDFANEAQGFSFTGGLPSDLDPNVAALVQKLLLAETQFRAASAALSAVP